MPWSRDHVGITSQGPASFAFVESNVDTLNGSVHCAGSPSGAFLD